VWLERNKLCFTNHVGKTATMLGSHILSLTKHWCTSKGKVDLLKLSLILPQGVEALMHVPVVPIEVPIEVELDDLERELEEKMETLTWDHHIVALVDLPLFEREIERYIA
jgi:hypothetical protein